MSCVWIGLWVDVYNADVLHFGLFLSPSVSLCPPPLLSLSVSLLFRPPPPTQIEDLRQRLHERDEEKVCIIDRANSDIGALQQQLKVLRRQLLCARQGHDGAEDKNSSVINDHDDDNNSDGGSVVSASSAPTPRRRSRLQPVPPVLRVSSAHASARGRERDAAEHMASKAPHASKDALRAVSSHTREKRSGGGGRVDKTGKTRYISSNAFVACAMQCRGAILVLPRPLSVLIHYSALLTPLAPTLALR